MLSSRLLITCNQLQSKAIYCLLAFKYSSNSKKKDVVKRDTTSASSGNEEYFQNLMKNLQVTSVAPTSNEEVLLDQDLDQKTELTHISDKCAEASYIKHDSSRNMCSVSQLILLEHNNGNIKTSSPVSCYGTDVNNYFKKKITQKIAQHEKPILKNTENIQSNDLDDSDSENSNTTIPKQLPNELSEEEFKKFDKSLNFGDNSIDDLSPYLPSTFNFASYANNSETLQQLIKLGVELFKWEKYHNVMHYILRLDFEKDMKTYIQFLHRKGVPAESLGRFITKNPLIFQQSMENLKIRLNYLKSKKFSCKDIARIITSAPTYVNFPVVKVDYRLGYFQKEFQLSGDEIRYLITKYPKLAVCDLRKIQVMKFYIKEEMGFSDDEMKTLLLQTPKVWLSSIPILKKKFQFLHNEVGISHEQIIQNCEVLKSRFERLKQRHSFLNKIGRAQYNPKKENYVSLKNLVLGNDTEFCENIAKASVEKYNEFLKTL